MSRLLLIEDDPDLGRCLADNLTEEGFRVERAETGEEGLERALRGGHALILLDVMLPGVDGFTICREVRARFPSLPIIVISARDRENDKVVGLDLGADDYVTKPFGVSEILARIRAVLRRSPRPIAVAGRVRVGDLEIDFERQCLERDGESEKLGHYESLILRQLISREGEVVRREELIQEIWGVPANPRDRAVDNYVAKLRRKLEDDPRRPRHVVTVHGVGYRFVR